MIHLQLVGERAQQWLAPTPQGLTPARQQQAPAPPQPAPPRAADAGRPRDPPFAVRGGVVYLLDRATPPAAADAPGRPPPPSEPERTPVDARAAAPMLRRLRAALAQASLHPAARAATRRALDDIERALAARDPDRARIDARLARLTWILRRTGALERAGSSLAGPLHDAVVALSPRLEVPPA